MNFLEVGYFEVVKRELPLQFSLSDREAYLWQSNKMDHALDFLKAIPISGLNQSVGPRQFRVILEYRLGIPLFEADTLCTVCDKPMDIYCDHALHCAKEVGLKFRHDMVRDVFADICYKAGVAARKEVYLDFSSANDTGLNPADILLYIWENGRDVCFDVTSVSPFTSAATRTFVPGHAIAAAITRKRNKYLDICTAHGYGFGALAFTTLGELNEDIVVFLKRLKNCLASYDANYKVGSSLFHRIGLAVQKAVGAQLVARLPTVPV